MVLYCLYVPQVRIFKFKTEAYATATSFMPLQGTIRHMISL